MSSKPGSIALICLLAILLTPCIGVSAPTGALFLVEEPSARMVAAGGAGAAAASGLESMRYNEAGLAASNGFEASLAHHRDAAGWNNEWAAFGFPAGPAHIGCEVLYSRLDPIANYDENGGFLGEINVGSQVVGLGGAVDLGSSGLSLGLAGRGFTTQVAQYSNAGWAIDAGAQYSPGLIPLRLGISVQNMGSQTAYISKVAPLPFGGRFGASWLFSRDAFTLEAKGDYDYFPDTKSVAPWRLGLESGFLKRFFASTGAKISESRVLYGFGAGIKVDTFSIFYAFLPDDIIGNSHFISFEVRG